MRRRVALKIIKLGMDTRQVVARFEQERQALAMMDHPNIAKVFDAGATPTGRPFFVMELVRSIRITDYCDQACGLAHNLSNTKAADFAWLHRCRTLMTSRSLKANCRNPLRWQSQEYQCSSPLCVR